MSNLISFLEYAKHDKVIDLFDCKKYNKKCIFNACEKLNIDVWFLD